MSVTSPAASDTASRHRNARGRFRAILLWTVWTAPLLFAGLLTVGLNRIAALDRRPFWDEDGGASVDEDLWIPSPVPTGERSEPAALSLGPEG